MATARAVAGAGDRSYIRRLGLGAVVVAAAAGTAAVAAAQGGYFPTAWGWTALALFWVAGLALVLVDELALSRAEIVYLGILAALVGWTALSIAWSASVSDSVAELERALVYAAASLAFLLVARRGLVVPLLGALLVGMTGICAYALATRLFPSELAPDLFGGYRLSTPIGYWNGLGLLAGMAALLAIGFASSSLALGWRAAAAAALPLLAVTLYFTYSRGAWVALGAGFLLAVALDPSRLRLVTVTLVLAPGPALAVWLASQSSALTHVGGSIDASTHEGRRLAVWVVVFGALAAASAAGLGACARRVTVSARVRRAYAVLLGALALAGIVAALAAGGGPVALGRSAYASFTASPTSGSDLNSRLFQLSSNGRTELWHVAWKQFETRPLGGTGAGTYAGFYYAHRTSQQTVQNAHSLYLETLGTLGVVGAVLVLALLAVPFAGARARARPLVPAALGVFTALIVHAVYDWDWQLPVLVLVGTWCGLAALVEARESRPVVRVATRGRAALLGTVVAAGAFAFVGLVGNMASASSSRALSHANWARAAGQARRAAAWNPWAARPLYLLALADLGRSRHDAAVADLHRAIDRAPQSWVIWQQLADVTQGRERRTALLRLHELNPLGDSP